MKIQSLEELFLTSLQYLYDAEKQLTEALPKMAKASHTPQLRQAFESHLAETQEHARRVEQIFKSFDHMPEIKPNSVVQAMGKEADGMVKSIEAGPVRDAALMEAANQVEHWEIGAYLSLRNYAQVLNKHDVVLALERIINEEKRAAANVTEIGHGILKHVPQHAAAAAH